MALGLKLVLAAMFLLFVVAFYKATDGFRTMNKRDLPGDLLLLATGTLMVLAAYALRRLGGS